MTDIRARVSAVITAEAEAIAAIHVTEAFVHAVMLLHDVSGKVIATGMGKAGHVAQKFAATLCATGTPAVYLHPGDAAHGDLGVIAPGDCLVAFSTSGKTREVLHVADIGRRLGLATIISITAHEDSALRALSDVVLDMGPIDEPCPHGLTPSASTAVMLAISDAIALVLMELKGLSREDFGLRHHAGYLGAKALDVKA